MHKLDKLINFLSSMKYHHCVSWFRIINLINKYLLYFVLGSRKRMRKGPRPQGTSLFYYQEDKTW